MRLFVFTRYGRLGASSRLRMLQYISHLERAGWEVDVAHLFSDNYIRALYGRKGLFREIASGYFNRLRALLRVGTYDLIWIEKELFPFLPAWAERVLEASGIPSVVDYDDAWFHRYDNHSSRPVRAVLKGKIDTVMRNAASVVVGNAYLADRAESAGARQVEIIPTVVDPARYGIVPREANQPLTVGWIGSPKTCGYLRAIAPVLDYAKKNFKVRIVAVGADKAGLKELAAEIWPWSEETESRSIQEFDVGIMPLPDESWERGKCGYKLIQYMACGRPVVASPVGVNAHLVEHGVNGFLAGTLEEWKTALASLLGNMDLRAAMGQKGREKVENEYCLQVQAPRLERILRRALRRVGS